MIRFFSKQRFQFFSQNKTFKYLKYAIGETTLVVIGILIALYINNLNEINKDRIREKAILKEVHKDFKKNLTNFLNVKESYEELLSASTKFKKFINHPTPLKVIDSIGKYYSLAFNGYTYNPSNGVAESLIASGEYQLIRNDALRNLLISWKDVLEDYIEEEKIANAFWSEKIEPYIIEHGDFSNLSSKENLKIMNSRKFKNLIERYIYSLQIVVSSIENEPLKEHLTQIVILSETSLTELYPE